MKRLILTYLEKALSKIFKVKNLEQKLCHQVLEAYLSDQAGSGSDSEIAASTPLM